MECLVPSLRDTIDDTLNDIDGFNQVNEFAQSLAQKKRVWDGADRIKYKALLEASGHPDLKKATELMHGLEDYELRRDIAESWDYADLVLREKYPDLPEEHVPDGRRRPGSAKNGWRRATRPSRTMAWIRRKDGSPLPCFRQDQAQKAQLQRGGMKMR